MEPVEIEQPPEEHHEITEEDRRLVSSDLEDCPELWQGELGNYIMETHKRQRQIDNWFGHWVIVRFSPLSRFSLPNCLSAHFIPIESGCVNCGDALPCLCGPNLPNTTSPTTSTSPTYSRRRTASCSQSSIAFRCLCRRPRNGPSRFYSGR